MTSGNSIINLTYGVNGKVWTLLITCMKVVLNVQIYSWDLVKTRVCLELVLGTSILFTSILYLESNCKIFADDASLSYKVLIKLVPRATLKKDFELINNWAFQWKIQLNPGQNKQAR